MPSFKRLTHHPPHLIYYAVKLGKSPSDMAITKKVKAILK